MNDCPFFLFSLFSGVSRAFRPELTPTSLSPVSWTPEYFEYFYFSFSRLFGCFTGLSVRN
jgi:hypothetical protein